MSEELREQIRNNMNLKDIYELLEIWKINNRVVWSDMTFEVVFEILKERMREIPPQDEPIFEEEEIIQDSDDDLENWEVRLLDDGNQPELYNTLDVLKLKDNINRVAIAVIIFYSLITLLNLQFVRSLFQGDTLSSSEIINSIPDALIAFLGLGLQIAVLYFPLKALSQILRILMEIEFNSRKAN